jgi:hypothetical protein
MRDEQSFVLFDLDGYAQRIHRGVQGDDVGLDGDSELSQQL